MFLKTQTNRSTSKTKTILLTSATNIATVIVQIFIQTNSISWNLKKKKKEKNEKIPKEIECLHYCQFCFLWQKFLVNQGYVTLAITVWSEFCDLMHMPFYILTLLQVSNYYLENCRGRGNTNYAIYLIRVLWHWCTCQVSILILLRFKSISWKL